MAVRHLVIGTLICTLAGCASIQPESSEISVTAIAVSEQLSASLILPKDITNTYKRGDGSTSYTTFEAPTTDYRASDYYIEIYPSMTDELSDCITPLTGASSMQSLQNTNGITSWGRVDAYDSYQPSFADGETPFCRPPILDWNIDVAGRLERVSKDAAYALCSEKDGKRVLICISQMTDNPQLAEEIFGTFRWED